MPYQNISVVVPQANIDAVKAAIATINTNLPFLIALDASERQSLLKLGGKSADFVQDATGAVASFPNVFPQTFDKIEYAKDTTLFKVLGDLKLPLDSLYEKFNDTYMAVGSEAMVASLEVYAYVQTAADRTPGLKSVAEKLKERFKNRGIRKKSSSGQEPKP